MTRESFLACAAFPCTHFQFCPGELVARIRKMYTRAPEKH
jgi:hypothetical protein